MKKSYTWSEFWDGREIRIKNLLIICEHKNVQKALFCNGSWLDFCLDCASAKNQEGYWRALGNL